MYNLLITAWDGAWERSAFEYPTSRFLMEYMEQGLKEQFAQLDKKAVKTLCGLPTLFMYEEQLKLPGRLGRITSIHKHSGTVFFNFKLDPHSPPIDWELLKDLTSELQITRYERTRTHWAVKDVDLMKVLQPILREHKVQDTSLAPSQSRVEVAPPSQALGTTAPADIAILTVIQPELLAVLDALNISSAAREKTAQGTVYFRSAIRSHLARRDYQLVVTCIGAAGNYDASAAASEIIATHRPRFLLLVGIAAGIRGKVKIGEVVFSERIVAYEPGAVVASEAGGASHTEPRPGIDKLHHSVNQDVVTYRPDPTRLETLFHHIHGTYPTAPRGKKREFQQHVATAISPRTSTLASGEKLLKDPAKLLTVREQQHGKVEVGEMEAAGLVTACHRASIPWLVIRGISDFGDALKNDQFHDFASRAAATVLADFLAHGLSLPAHPRDSGYALTALVPLYPDDETQRLSLQIERARERKQRLQQAGESTSQVDREILSLRRQIREGGQLRAGDSLGEGRYLLIELIGQGGFAHIWKAADRVHPAAVAIKVLHTNLAGDPHKRERFFRGARRMAELQHPAVVPVLERHGEDGGYHYFVMEYVAGGDLREAVLEKALTQEQFLSVILRIGEALALAHTRGLIHRDVKPANILLPVPERPLLTDFDLVGAADTTGGTRTGAMGTIIYAAPECLDRPQEADPRADIYSLGMTTIFGLHGADLPLHMLRNPELVVSQLPCSQALKEVLSKAISLNPDDRYQSVGEFLAALQQASPIP